MAWESGWTNWSYQNVEHEGRSLPKVADKDFSKVLLENKLLGNGIVSSLAPA